MTSPAVRLRDTAAQIAGYLLADDMMTGFSMLQEVLDASATTTTLPTARMLRRVVLTLLTRQADPACPGVREQLLWLRRFFLQYLLKLLQTPDPRKRRAYLLATDTLFFLLRNTPSSDDHHSVVAFWEEVVRFFTTRSAPDFLGVVAQTLNELFRLSIRVSANDANDANDATDATDANEPTRRE